MAAPSESELNELIEQDQAYLLPNWQRRPGVKPVLMVRGEGSCLWDARGKKYIDFASQNINVNIGYGNRKVIDAIKNQAEQLSYIGPAFAAVPRARLAKRLEEITPGDLTKSFFCSDGGEAVESAIKIARQFTGRPKIVSLWQAYHGSSLVNLSVGGVTRIRSPFEPLPTGFTHVSPPYCFRCDLNSKYPDCDAACARLVEKVIKWEDPEKVAAFVAEPVLGSGIIVPPKEYLPIIRETCDRLGVLLILDEVLTGFGRTGKMFACEHSGVTPDILVVGKGMTSAYLPLSGVTVRKHIGDAFVNKTMMHGYTYSNHPLCCAAALAAIDVLLEERLVENSARLGSHLLKRIEEFEHSYRCVGEARGIGLLSAIELVADKKTRQPLGEYLKDDACFPVARKTAEKGVLTGASIFAPNALRLSPPLCITERQVDDALDVVGQVLADVDAGLR
jgi:taurine--2-oxoglutarate transaminase